MIQAAADNIDPLDAPAVIRDGARPAKPMLTVSDLQVEFVGRGRTVRAVRGLSYEIGPGRDDRPGRRVGLRQERQRAVAAGPAAEARRQGVRRDRASSRARTSSTMSEDELRKIRGAQIAMIFQDPLSSLNPVLTIGRQITEAIETHKGVGSKDAKKRAIELLELVGIPSAAAPGQRLPAPVQRRHAPARDDRDGPELRAEPAHRRRADHRARRDDPGADPRPAPPAPDRARDGRPDHHPRPRRRGRVRRPAGRHVRRAPRRARADRDAPGRPGAPLHHRAAAVAAAPGPPTAGGPDPDRGLAAGPRVDPSRAVRSRPAAPGA